MSITTVLPAVDGDVAAEPRTLEQRRGRGDKFFSGLMASSGSVVLITMSAVGLFLALESIPAFRRTGFSFFTTSAWQPSTGEFGVAAIIGFTVMIAAIAVAVALPISLATSLFITEIAPRRLRGALVAMVDLMAAVPSVVYGVWGALVLQPHSTGVAQFLASWFGWIPLFDVSGHDPSNPLSSPAVFLASSFTAGLVVSMMVMPIQCSVMREVFSQVPAGEREGAFALGSTRWGMITVVSLPFGRGGIIGGTMLGLGRALGETIAVVLIISPRFDFSFHMLETGSNSVSALIALRFAEASDFDLSALMAAGLTLFMMTLVVNFVASWFVARSRSGASSEA
jgi:phosphate transport system permease protein